MCIRDRQNTVKVYGVKANGTETDLTGQFTPTPVSYTHLDVYKRQVCG